MKHKKGTALIEEQLANIARYLSTPVATYTHSTNTEVVVSAVDVDTDTFTSVGHGLVNNDVIFPTLNTNPGAVYPLQVYAGGMVQGLYYVVNKTDDTFQLSLTSGGAAINLTANATIDLTKWHFESFVLSITINNLPASKRYKIKLMSKAAAAGYISLSLNGTNPGNAFALSTLATYSDCKLVNAIGSISSRSEFIIDTNGRMFVEGYANCINVNAAQAAQYSSTLQQIYTRCMTNYMQATDITSITIELLYRGITNGSTVEVYKV